MLQTLKIYN